MSAGEQTVPSTEHAAPFATGAHVPTDAPDASVHVPLQLSDPTLQTSFVCRQNDEAAHCPP